EILIPTGRTHQIRVHLSSAGYPLLGDLKYGGRPAARLMLHAARLAHPAIGAWDAPVPF
ncbi:MAG TPA: RluA family pseudouridine synthase, partial [Thermoanaerobaculia bacterium]